MLQRVRANFGADGARTPWLVFWVALAVRLLYLTLAHTYRIRALDDHFQFGWEEGRIARALVGGRGYADPFDGQSGPTAWTPPLYPLVLAGAFKLFGVYTRGAAWVVLAFNCVCSALCVPLVWELALRCFGRDARGERVARWAGWTWALYPAALQYAVHWVWDMSLSTVLFTLALVLTLRLRGLGDAEPRPPTVGQWIGYGAVWGLLALSNSSLLLALPCALGWLVWGAAPRQRGRVVLRATLACACFVLVLSPWVVRNWRVLHAFVPMRSNLGVELYQAALPINEGLPWGGVFQMGGRSPEFDRYCAMGEIAYSKAKGRAATAMIRARPGLYLRWTVQRVYLFWFGVPHAVERGAMSWVGEATRELNYSFVSVAALLGLGLALRRGVPAAGLWVACFLAVPLVYYLVTVQARFRHPLEPLMTVLIVYLFQSAERRSKLGQ